MKIIKTANYKKLSALPGENIDWGTTEAIARKMTVSELLHAIDDAQETIRMQEPGGLPVGKYYDQISIYRDVLRKKQRQVQTETVNNIDDIMRSGLGEWVKDYIKMRRMGNISGARDIKKNIDIEIKKHNLNSRDVYFYYGDPDDPSTRFEVRENIEGKM